MCNVSTAAVTQLIGALESDLGIALFRRSRRGLALTAEGERYHETTRALAQALADTEERLTSRGANPRGTLSIGFRQQLGQLFLAPRLARFLAQYPEIELVLKPVTSVIEMRATDVAVLIGWPPEQDYVVRMLGQTQLFVCASPDYWRRAGVPRDPDNLHEHHCMILRSSGGALLDRWLFEKQGDKRTIDVKARVFSDEAGVLVSAALAGAGVIRAADIVLADHLATGRLVRVLSDWNALEAPFVYAAYHTRLRRSPLVRVFMQFLKEAFDADDHGRSARVGYPTVRPPEWFGKTQGRQSAYERRRRK